MIQLVTVTKAFTSVTPVLLTMYGDLTLHFVPEANTLLLAGRQAGAQLILLSGLVLLILDVPADCSLGARQSGRRISCIVPCVQGKAKETSD